MKKRDSTRRWGSKINCCIAMYTSDLFAKSKIATREPIALYSLQCENVSLPAPLCKHHYHLLYNTLQTRCYTCQATLRNGSRIRTCPDAKLIQQYLADKIGFDGTIPDDARVCTSCYKTQLLILKEAPKSTDTTVTNM